MSAGGGQGERGDKGLAGARLRLELRAQASCIRSCGSQGEGGFQAAVLPFWPTVPPEGSAYTTAEPHPHGRDLGAKTEGSRVKMVVYALTATGGWKA